MTIQELIYKNSRLYSLEGKEVKALPVGPPETIAGFPGESDIDKRSVDHLLETVVEQYVDAYVRGTVDKRTKTDAPYVPIQFYRLA